MSKDTVDAASGGLLPKQGVDEIVETLSRKLRRNGASTRTVTVAKSQAKADLKALMLSILESCLGEMEAVSEEVPFGISEAAYADRKRKIIHNNVRQSAIDKLRSLLNE